MGKVITFTAFFGLIFVLFLAPTPALADDLIIRIPEVQATPPPAEKIDPRVLILNNYLDEYNSPLKEHAKDFIEAADRFGLDWKLVAAIAGVESTFGKKIPGGANPTFTSYNGWGWGVYGNKVLRFPSWKDGIYTVSEGLKKDYIDKGLTNPYAINSKYSTSREWGGNVDYFLADLDSYTKSYPLPHENKPEVTRIFQNDAYIKVEKDHFSLQYVE